MHKNEFKIFPENANLGEVKRAIDKYKHDGKIYRRTFEAMACPQSDIGTFEVRTTPIPVFFDLVQLGYAKSDFNAVLNHGRVTVLGEPIVAASTGPNDSHYNLLLRVTIEGQENANAYVIKDNLSFMLRVDL